MLKKVSRNKLFSCRGTKSQYYGLGSLSLKTEYAGSSQSIALLPDS